MTDTVAALDLLAESDLAERAQALADFYTCWRDDALVVDKWFALQAMAQRQDAVEVVTGLLGHEAFTIRNPNRVRALIGAFAAGNPTGFHRADGKGYALIADHVLELDPRNPQVASRLAKAFDRWRRYNSQRQAKMRTQLERILAAPKLPATCTRSRARACNDLMRAPLESNETIRALRIDQGRRSQHRQDQP